MTDPLYLISLCPCALRPALGDRVMISLAEPGVGQQRDMEIQLRSGVSLACERVTMDTAGALIRFPPQPIVGIVSQVRAMPSRHGASINLPPLVAIGLSPEDVLIGVAIDQS